VIESPFEVIEPPFEVIEPPFKVVDPIFEVVEPLFKMVEPPFKVVEPHLQPHDPFPQHADIAAKLAHVFPDAVLSRLHVSSNTLVLKDHVLAEAPFHRRHVLLHCPHVVAEAAFHCPHVVAEASLHGVQGSEQSAAECDECHREGQHRDPLRRPSSRKSVALIGHGHDSQGSIRSAQYNPHGGIAGLSRVRPRCGIVPERVGLRLDLRRPREPWPDLRCAYAACGARQQRSVIHH